MSIVSGIDSGGTKTIFAACDRHANITSFRLLESIAPTPKANWVYKFDELLYRNKAIVEQSEQLVLGLPFHGEDPVYSDQQCDVVNLRLGDRALVENDVRIAFDGAFAGLAGVLILAGTGSMAWGSLNGPADPHFRVGGWGEMIGDEGSAFWIGLRSLHVISRHLDGREDTEAFSNRILNDINVGPRQFHAWINSVEEPRKIFASLAATVSDLAQSGNTTAHTILTEAADHLAEHVQTVWRQIKTEQPLAWSYAGGVFNSPYVLKRLQERLNNAPLPPRLPPIGGALLRAAQNAGWSINDDWISKLAISLEEQR